MNKLMIKLGGKKEPIREHPVPNLWHLARAIGKTGGSLSKARAEEIASASHAESVLETLLGDAPLRDGELASETILGVWHLAHGATRALLRIERQLQEAIESLDAARHEGALDRSGIAGLRQLLTGALEGVE